MFDLLLVELEDLVCRGLLVLDDEDDDDDDDDVALALCRCRRGFGDYGKTKQIKKNIKNRIIFVVLAVWEERQKVHKARPG